MAPYFSPYLRNCRIDGQSIIIRPWHQLLVSLTSWSYPKWIGSYLRTVAANDRLIVRHNTDSTHKLYTIAEDGTATSIDTSTNIASDNRMTFTNVADVVYCMNWSDNFWKLSDTTYTTPSTGISNFNPSYWVVFWWSHWVSWYSTAPNKVYKSVADNYEDFASAWSDSFTFSEQVTGLSANSQALFYFTKNTISVTDQNDIQDTAGTITYNTRSLQVKEWAINHYAIIEAWNSIYYVTPSNSINKLARWNNIYWFEAIELSDRSNSWISKLMASLDPDQSWCWWYYLQDKMIIKWFFKSAGASFNDVCIVYDTIKDAFLVDGQEYFYDGCNFKGKNYTVSTIEPKVYQDEYSQDDEGTPIPREYRTNELYFTANPYNKKVVWSSETLLDVNELAQPTQKIFINWSEVDTHTLNWTSVVSTEWGIWEWSVWDDAIWDDWGWDEMMMVDDDYTETYIKRTKGNLNKKWYKVQRRFTNSSLAGKVRLKNIIPMIEILPEIATSLSP